LSFEVTVAAADRGLLTLAEIKSALGISDSFHDAELTSLGLQVSDLISEECCVQSDGIAIPTLMRETVEEAVRITKNTYPLILARRFVAAISSVEINGSALAATDYDIDKSPGLLTRLSSDQQIAWESGTKVVITYTAGFAEVPGALKRAALTVIREQYSTDQRDPLTKRERIDGIGETEWWVNASSGSSSVNAISGVAAAMLDPYRYMAV
jgi:hypothetical protein